ncbi:hypothetical protein DFP73DRAFT_526472 [Morchella snyderi]|nr:hypothetical protein DFP73DRAFT_526472 [Morchella snyderi]
MPRKLPWATLIPKPPTSRSSPPNKRRRISTPTSPSSPAPAHKPIPPTTTNATARNGSSDKGKNADLSTPVYMLPSDERYLMVEDEFLSVAQTYTRSLHRAEYERLQRLAKTTHARRITEIQRPVAGVQRMSKAVVLKKNDSDSSSEEEDAVVHSVWGKSSLGLLMCRPKDEEKDLFAGWKVGAGARPAAKAPRAAKREPLERPELKRERPAAKGEPMGRLQPVKEPTLPAPEPCASTASGESSDDDDDLDAPVVRKNQTQASASSLRSSPPSFSSTLASHPSSSSSMPSFSQPQSSQPEPYLRPSQIKREIPDFDFGFEAVNQRSAAYRGRTMARRQAGSLAHKR